MFEGMMESMLAPVCWRRVKSDCLCIMLCTFIVYAGTAYATLAGASPEAGIAVSLAVGAMVTSPCCRLELFLLYRLLALLFAAMLAVYKPRLYSPCGFV